MMRINQFLFYEICGKDMDMYEDITKSVKIDYRNTIRDLGNSSTWESAIFHTHKLMGVISILKNTNEEVLYLCKSLLQLSKTSEDYASYAYFIDQLVSIDMRNIGL